MLEPASPFTLDQLVALLEREGLPYVYQDALSVLVSLCCDRVPHEFLIRVDAEHGYCAIYQNRLGYCAPASAGAARVGEACRFALMLNAQVLFGGFRLTDHRYAGLSFGTMIPTADALLTPAQLQQTIAALCAEIDDFYPLLQAVLWGGVSAEEGLARFHCLHSGDDGSEDTAGNQHGDDPDAGIHALRSERGEEFELSATVPQRRSDDEIDRIDDAFLQALEPSDPFSVAAAEAILRRRGVQQHGAADTAGDS